MSKKNQKRQLVLSLIGLFSIFTISSFFYLSDERINDEYGQNVRLLETNSSFVKANTFSDNDFNIPDLDINNNYLSEIKDLHDSLERDIAEKDVIPDVSEISIKEIVKIERKARLAIVIDDVAFKYQIKRLKKLNLPITLSFFPSDINHPHTSKYARNEFIPMVHFPLEAQNFKNEEIRTLHVGDSLELIESRVSQIVRQFPNIRYTNNHTGSKFTADYNSMKKLLITFKKYNIQFIDSVTTSKSSVKKISAEIGVRYIRRDIFLDNILEVSYITKQLKKAIAKAKKDGYAVAIGHPHKATIEALSKIKPLLNGVNLVYINEI